MNNNIMNLQLFLLQLNEIQRLPFRKERNGIKKNGKRGNIYNIMQIDWSDRKRRERKIK